VALANGRVVRVRVPNTGGTEGLRMSRGDTVWLGWAAQASVLLTS